LGVMSLFEASRGRDSQSLFYSGQSIRMAVEMGLHCTVLEDEIPDIEREVRSATIWGAFTLDLAWSTVMRRVPHLSLHELPTVYPVRPEPEELREWLPYTGDGVPIDENLTQMSNTRTIHIAMCSLSEILRGSLYVLHVPVRLLNARDVLHIYTRYLAWHDSLAATLRLGENSTPAVIFMHMFYQYAILLLFSPFIKLRFANSVILPYEICIQAADAIRSLLSSYHHLYTLRRTPCFVPFIALASNAMDMVRTEALALLFTPQLLQNVANLHEIAFSHISAASGAEALEALPIALGGAEGSEEEYLNALFTESMNISNSDPESFLPPDKPRQSIFSPFPSQVCPLPTFEEKLNLAGFELIG